jgi:hypothetical protein
VTQWSEQISAFVLQSVNLRQRSRLWGYISALVLGACLASIFVAALLWAGPTELVQRVKRLYSAQLPQAGQQLSTSEQRQPSSPRSQVGEAGVSDGVAAVEVAEPQRAALLAPVRKLPAQRAANTAGSAPAPAQFAPTQLQRHPVSPVRRSAVRVFTPAIPVFTSSPAVVSPNSGQHSRAEPETPETPTPLRSSASQIPPTHFKLIPELPSP